MTIGLLAEGLDERAGQWPWNLAEGFGKVATRCLSIGDDDAGDSGIVTITEELGRMRREAEAHLTVQKSQGMISNVRGSIDLKDVPSAFICPIFRVWPFLSARIKFELPLL